MVEVDRRWAERIKGGDVRALTRQFSHEAGELRRLQRDATRATAPAWRDFRQFLADVGPSPGPAYELQSLNVAETLGRDNVQWVVRPKRLQPLPPKPPATPGSSYSQWTMIAGMPVQYADLPARLGVSFADMSRAAAAGEGSSGGAQIEGGDEDGVDVAWFSDSASHREAFRQAYLAWRLKVAPRHRQEATPQFLYLYMLAPAMTRAKAVLEREGLWAPVTPKAVTRRDAHAAWARFNDLSPKAAAMIEGFEIYRRYSLPRDVDLLSARVIEAEADLRREG